MSEDVFETRGQGRPPKRIRPTVEGARLSPRQVAIDDVRDGGPSTLSLSVNVGGLFRHREEPEEVPDVSTPVLEPHHTNCRSGQIYCERLFYLWEAGGLPMHSVRINHRDRLVRTMTAISRMRVEPAWQGADYVIEGLRATVGYRLELIARDRNIQNNKSAAMSELFTQIDQIHGHDTSAPLAEEATRIAHTDRVRAREQNRDRGRDLCIGEP